MGVTIEQLNSKYSAEDKNWNFRLFPAWLQKKGIPNIPEMPVVAATLEQVLIEFSPETLPEKHHDFDNLVLKMATENKEKLNSAMLEILEGRVQESLAESLVKNNADWQAKIEETIQKSDVDWQTKMKEMIEQAVKDYDADWYAKSKVKKVWEVVRGKD